MNQSPSTRAITSTARRRFCLYLLGGALFLIFGTGCFTETGGGSFNMPISLLERDGGATTVAIDPSTTEQISDGVFHYVGMAQAQIAGDSAAGRSATTIAGAADATVNENTGERTFVFTSAHPTDLGWEGVNAETVSIMGSGPPSGGTATLVGGAALTGERSSGWGFTTTSVNIAANIAGSSPIFTVASEGGSVGNPLAVVGAPNPGGVSIDATGLGLIFAPVPGDSALGAVEAGNWVRFSLTGSPGLTQGAASLAWNPTARTLRGAGSPGYLSVVGTAVNSAVELTADANSSYLHFAGQLDTPHLGVLNDASGDLWTDSTCTDCANIEFTGSNLAVSTIQIPSVTARQEVRSGVPTSSIVSATGVNGSLGPVTINSGNLSADFSDPANMIADLQVTGSVLGLPVTTTFHGPFALDLGQGQIDLTGDLYLDLSGKVVLNGNLHTKVSTAGVQVDYDGTLAFPTYGGNFNVLGGATYDLNAKTFNLAVDATGTVGPIAVNGVAVRLDLAQAGTGGITVSGSINVGSVTAGTASLSNLKIALAGNTSATVSATINSTTDRVRLKVGSTADITAYGSLAYTVPTNSLAFAMNFDGRVGSWQASGGSVSVSWPGSGPVTGAITAGRISNGQITVSNAVVDFSASTTSVTANLRSTTLTVGNLVSATVAGSATYTVSTNTFALNLNATGRVGSWNVSGVSASINWPGSGSVTGTLTVGQVSNGQVTVSNAVVDVTASTTSVTANLRPTSVTAGTLVSATVSGTATYNTSNSTMTLALTASGRVGPVNVTGVQANIVWPQSGNVTGSVSIGTVTYGPASLTGSTINFSANSSTLTASISSTLAVGDPFKLNVALAGSATYNLSTNVLNVSITTGSGTMWGKPISGNVTFNVNISGSTISGSVSTSSLRINYDKFGISLSSTTLNFSVANGAVSVTGGGNVAVNGPMGNGWLSGSGVFTVNGGVLKSTNYHITLNNMNKTITWVDVGPRNGAPLSVDIAAGSLSYDAQGKMKARVDTGFPLYCEDLEFNIHAWGDQNVLRVDFEGSYVIGLFGASGHMDVYDWLSSTNPPMYGYADVRITFFWFRYQTWNGQSLDNGGC